MAKVAPVGEPPSADEEEPKGAALESSAVGDAHGVADNAGGGGGGDVLWYQYMYAADVPANGNGRLPSLLRSGSTASDLLSRKYRQRAEEYEALLSKVTKSSKRAKLMSVQGVLFGFTFMMSTFETSNR